MEVLIALPLIKILNVAKTKIVEEKISGTKSMMTRFTLDQQIQEAVEDRKTEVVREVEEDTIKIHLRAIITTPDSMEDLIKIDIKINHQEALIDMKLREDLLEEVAAEEACHLLITEEKVHKEDKGTTSIVVNMDHKTTTTIMTIAHTTWVHHQVDTTSTLLTEMGQEDLEEEVLQEQEGDHIPEILEVQICMNMTQGIQVLP